MRAVRLLLLLVPSLVLAHAGLEADVARLTKALDEAPSAALYLQRAGKLRLLGRIDQALADTTRARDRGASALDVSQARGLCFAAAGDTTNALEELDAVVKGGSVSVPALRARAAMLEKVGRGEEAVLDLARAEALFPEPDVVLERARLQERLGRPGDAARTLERGLETLGGAVTVRLELIALYRRTRQQALALKHARAAAAPLPAKVEWQVLAAEILLEQGHRREARTELTAALKDLDAALAARPNGLQQQARDRAVALLEKTRPRRSASKESRP